MLADNKLPEMIVIDLEASGLHDGSFPIEVGWCLGDLTSHSFLIRPHETWEDKDWRWESEQIHGIPMRDCLRHGLEVDVAARRLNDALRGFYVLSNAPAYDGMWMKRLFDAARIKPEFALMDYNVVLRGVAYGMSSVELGALYSKVKQLFAYTHRAEDDAKFLAALLISTGGCYEEVAAACARHGQAAL